MSSDDNDGKGDGGDERARCDSAISAMTDFSGMSVSERDQTWEKLRSNKTKLSSHVLNCLRVAHTSVGTKKQFEVYGRHLFKHLREDLRLETRVVTHLEEWYWKVGPFKLPSSIVSYDPCPYARTGLGV